MTKAIELSQLGNKLRVRSTGEVALGASADHRGGLLTVGDVDSPTFARAAVAIKSASSDSAVGTANLYLEESGGAEGYYINVDADGALLFNNSGSFTTLKLDDTNNILVGKTASSGLNAGCEFRPDGFGLFTRTSANAVQVRRLTDDGDFVEFYQDAGLIGSVGVDGTSLTIGMAGSTKLRITSDGKVLINDASLGNSRTDAPLQIETGGSGNALNLRARSSDDIYSYINFQNNAATQTAAEIYMVRSATNNAGNLVFGTANANSSTPQQRMMISSGGATTMHVNSASHETFRFTTQALNEAKLIMQDASGNSDIVLNTGGDSWFNGGDVGIGTNAPTRTLSVSGSVNIQSGERIESYSSGGNLIIQGGSTYPGGHIKMWGGTGDDMITFNTSGASASSTERLRINSAGNVSIGAKSDPNWSSTVDALTIGYAGVLYEDSYTSGTDNYLILGNNTFYNATSGGNTYIRNDEAQRIMMQGGSWWFQNAGAGTAGAGITFANRLRITSGGDVGIGTANPEAKLHVTGGRFVLNSDPTGEGQSYQVIQGYKSIPTSNSYVELAFVGHSHSIEVQFVVKQGASSWIYGGAHGKFSMFTAYGSTGGQVDMSQRRTAMNGGNITGDATFDYLNSGGSGGSYLLRVAVPFSSTNASMNISYVIKGLSSHYMYAL